jgi:hypothetical protein
MLLEELFETPKSILPTDFGLNDEKENRKQTMRFLRDADRELVKSFAHDINLYEVGRQFCLIDETNNHLIYYMRWEEIFHKFVGHRAACQIAVWRDQNKPGYEETAREIFFDHLLPKYGVVITDALQTPDGRTFWIRRVGDAFRRNLNVYYLNLMQSTDGVSRELIKIESVADFERLNKEKDFWGETEKFRARKIIISSVEL